MEALAVARLSVAVAHAAGPHEVAAVLLDEMALVAPDATVAVCLHDEPAGEFELIGVRTPDGHTVAAYDRWPFGLPSPAQDAVRSRAMVAMGLDEYVRRYPEVAAISDPGELAWYAALPIVAGERAVGAVGIAWRSTPVPDQRAVAHLQRLVDTGGLALGRAEADQAARRTRDLLERMVAQMPLGVLIVEPSVAAPAGLRVAYMNDAFRGIFGLHRELREGEPLARVLRMDGTEAPLEERPMVRATLHGETVRDETYLLEPPNHARRIISVNAAPVRDAAGRVLAGVAIYSDVTLHHEARAAREAFMGILSHELRTPVTSIYGGAELLLRRLRGDPETADLAAGLVEESARLQRLVENLLVLSRVEHGLDLRRDDPILLQHLARRIVDQEASQWPRHRFMLSAAVDLPAVAGDEGYVEQILVNLLSNARKYGAAPGSIRVVLDRGEDDRGMRDDAAPPVVLRVLNDGAGFEAGTEGRLFDLFYRAPTAARVAPGAGIGLFVVKALAEAMGARVMARRRPEGGAEVAVAFRACEADEPEER